MDEAIPLLVAQDKNPAFHKVVQGLKAVHPPRNVGFRVQPALLAKPSQMLLLFNRSPPDYPLHT